jgi:hypothetical protein
MGEATVMSDARDGERSAGYRYGAVLLCTVGVLVFLIVAPSEGWSRATALAMQALALLVAVATSRARVDVRRARALVVGAVTVVVVGGSASGGIPASAAAAIGALVSAAIPLAIVGGLVRLVREHGVTLQAVAGALAIYLQLGLIFAWVIGLFAHLDSAAYFEQGGDGSQSDRVYFSFTVLTTTGFGDLTPAHPAGRAIAVVEMLAGQLYLVTVIGVLVGGLVAGRRG